MAVVDFVGPKVEPVELSELIRRSDLSVTIVVAVQVETLDTALLTASASARREAMRKDSKELEEVLMLTFNHIIVTVRNLIQSKATEPEKL